MARTAEELLQEALKHTPVWFQAPNEVDEAALLALVVPLALFEAIDEALHDRTFLCKADGSWLDAHGSERLKARGDQEGDEAYRERIKVIPDAVTPVAIQKALDTKLQVGTAKILENGVDSFWTTETGSGLKRGFVDVDRTLGFAPLFLGGFVVIIQPQVPTKNKTSWTTDTGSGLVAGFTVDSPDVGGALFTAGASAAPANIYTQIFREIERIKPLAILFTVLVEP